MRIKRKAFSIKINSGKNWLILKICNNALAQIEIRADLCLLQLLRLTYFNQLKKIKAITNKKLKNLKNRQARNLCIKK